MTRPTAELYSNSTHLAVYFVMSMFVCLSTHITGNRTAELYQFLLAMGKMRNCRMWNAEGKMRNENAERQ